MDIYHDLYKKAAFNRDLYDKSIYWHNYRWNYKNDGNGNRADIAYYLQVFKDVIIDENNSLAFVRELLDSNDKDNTLIAATIVSNLKLK